MPFKDDASKFQFSDKMSNFSQDRKPSNIFDGSDILQEFTNAGNFANSSQQQVTLEVDQGVDWKNSVANDGTPFRATSTPDIVDNYGYKIPSINLNDVYNMSYEEYVAAYQLYPEFMSKMDSIIYDESATQIRGTDYIPGFDGFKDVLNQFTDSSTVEGSFLHNDKISDSVIIESLPSNSILDGNRVRIIDGNRVGIPGTSADDMNIPSKVPLNMISRSKDARYLGINQGQYKFVDKVEGAFNLLKPGKEETAASNIDEKYIQLVKFIERGEERNVEKYNKLLKSNKKEIKKIEKSIRRDKANANKNIKNPFLESRVTFKDDYSKFTDPTAGIFRAAGFDSSGNSIWLESQNSQIKSNIETIKNNNEADKFDSANNRNRKTYDGKDNNNLAKIDNNSKFATTTVKDGDNKNSKAVNSYFDDKKTDSLLQNNKFMTKEERIEHLKSDRKSIKADKKVANKRIGAMAAVANMLKLKKSLQNSIGNMSGEVSGNLIKDGAGIIGTAVNILLDSIKNKIKSLIVKGIAAITGMIFQTISTLFPFIILTIIVMSVTSILSTFTDSVGLPAGDGLTTYPFESLSNSEIYDILTELDESYDVCSTQKQVVAYALHKVGCAYNQNYHWDLTGDIYDCSSLAYRSYRELGIDVSNKGTYSAAEECRNAVNCGNVLTNTDLEPGDLIYYGGSNNGRYMGVYHVAIYIGNGKMVEARGTNWGVVYCDVRRSNIVAYARYI